MGTANVESSSRHGRQFGRRLSSQLQSRLSLGSAAARGPVYTRGQSVVSVSRPTVAPPRLSVANPIGPPSAFQQLQAPDVAPPSPPDVAPPGTPPPGTVLPPTAAPPSPPPTVAPITAAAGDVEARNIRCMQSSSRESLTATLVSRRPVVAPPVLTIRPAINPLTSAVCAMTSEDAGRRLMLAVTNLQACGVESCIQPNGERWLCLTIRFPLIAGIHLPEDDVIQLQCRPQDRSHTVGKQLSVKATGGKTSAGPSSRALTWLSGFDQLSPVLFTGGQQEFECEIALFRRTPGTSMFSTVVQAGDTITMGEELHLRSIIRSGDGWQYSKLTDVLVERESDNGDRLPTDTAPLVFSDGCRNPDFTILAPSHPARHLKNQLISNFAFRVFTFQGMTSGDTLQLSARVTGCVEAIDCAPTACPGGGQGYGRRRREADVGSNTTDWRRDLAFSVVIPDTPRGLAPERDTSVPPTAPSGCPAFLLGSLVAALACCLLLLASAVCVLNARRRRQLKATPACSDSQLIVAEPESPHGGGRVNHECGPALIDVGNGRYTVWGPSMRSWGVVDGAVTSPRGRCTARQLKRRRADVRRSFSAGNICCNCAAPGDGDLNKSNVSIVRVPAQENIYSEPTSKWDVQPTMV